jgi:hypothetical protein
MARTLEVHFLERMAELGAGSDRQLLEFCLSPTSDAPHLLTALEILTREVTLQH